MHPPGCAALALWGVGVYCQILFSAWSVVGERHVRSTLPAAGTATEWGELVQVHDNRAIVVASPDELPAIDRSPLVVRRPLVRCKSELPATSFLRVSRSLLVGLERITMVRWQWQGGFRPISRVQRTSGSKVGQQEGSG